MNLRQFEHVVALNEHRNFRRAADAVGLSQPALTQSIRNLEREYGVELFDRSHRDVTPTAFGLAMIHFAQQTLSRLDNLQRELSLMKNLESGRLIVGCDAWSAQGLVAPTLGRMLERYPGLRFSVRVGSIDEMKGALLAGDIDVYVGVPAEGRDDRLHWQDLTLPAMVLVCNPDHPVLNIKHPTPSDCLGYPVASPILPRWYYDWLNTHFGEPSTTQGKDVYSYFVESDDLGIIRHLVLTTDTISSMPLAVADNDLKQGLLKIIPLKEAEFPLSVAIVHPRSRPLAPAGERLLRELVEESRILWEQHGDRVDAASRYEATEIESGSW